MLMGKCGAYVKDVFKLLGQFKTSENAHTAHNEVLPVLMTNIHLLQLFESLFFRLVLFDGGAVALR